MLLQHSVGAAMLQWLLSVTKVLGYVYVFVLLVHYYLLVSCCMIPLPSLGPMCATCVKWVGPLICLERRSSELQEQRTTVTTVCKFRQHTAYNNDISLQPWNSSWRRRLHTRWHQAQQSHNSQCCHNTSTTTPGFVSCFTHTCTCFTQIWFFLWNVASDGRSNRAHQHDSTEFCYKASRESCAEQGLIDLELDCMQIVVLMDIKQWDVVCIWRIKQGDWQLKTELHALWDSPT